MTISDDMVMFGVPYICRFSIMTISDDMVCLVSHIVAGSQS